VSKGLKASFPLFFNMTEGKKETPVTETAPKKKTNILIFAIIAVLVIAFFAVKGNYADINNYFNPPPPAPVVHNLTAADVNLYKFFDIATNKTASIEIWLSNTGETTAKNITVFLRTRSNNGTILYQGNISLTSELLRSNETCSGILLFKTGKTVTKIYETLEVSWDSGRVSYQKETTI
jgi:hypothetical protein